MNNTDLFKRKGILRIPRNLIMSLDSNQLKQIFQNFYPIAIEISHSYDSIAYFGVSEFFDEIEIATHSRNYIIVLEKDEKGIDRFLRFDKVSN